MTATHRPQCYRRARCPHRAAPRYEGGTVKTVPYSPVGAIAGVTPDLIRGRNDVARPRRASPTVLP